VTSSSTKGLVLWGILHMHRENLSRAKVWRD
jgi:hypothetical protein